MFVLSCCTTEAVKGKNMRSNRKEREGSPTHKDVCTSVLLFCESGGAQSDAWYRSSPEWEKAPDGESSGLYQYAMFSNHKQHFPVIPELLCLPWEQRPQYHGSSSSGPWIYLSSVFAFQPEQHTYLHHHACMHNSWTHKAAPDAHAEVNAFIALAQQWH